MGLFSTDTSGDYLAAGDAYRQWEEKALQGITQAGQQGRADITGGTDRGVNALQPYSQAGGEALQQLMASMGLGKGGGGAQQGAYDKFTTSPGYQFALNQAKQTAQRSLAATGQVGSGAQLKTLSQLAEGTAQKEFGSWQDRLSSLANAGQQSATNIADLYSRSGSNLAQLGYGYTNMASNVYNNIGTSEAEMRMAAAQAKERANNQTWGSIGTLVGAGSKLAGM